MLSEWAEGYECRVDCEIMVGPPTFQVSRCQFKNLATRQGKQRADILTGQRAHCTNPRKNVEFILSFSRGIGQAKPADDRNEIVGLSTKSFLGRRVT